MRTADSRRRSGGEATPIEERTLLTSDGVPLTARIYSSGGRSDMTALMLPGVGVPQRAFRHLASWLAERGVRCVTVDYRGMAESTTPEGTASATLSAWARRDAAATLEHAESLGPEPVVLIAHSFGGQAVGLADALQRVRAAVFIASQFGQARYWDGAARWGLAFYWYVVLPLAAAVFDVLPGWTGPAGPLPRGVAREWALWGRSRSWYLDHDPEAADRLRRFSAPILAFAVSDDDIAPPRAVSALLERFEATRPVRRDLVPQDLGLDRLGHVGLLRPGPHTEPVWQQILDFLRERVP